MKNIIIVILFCTLLVSCKNRIPKPDSIVEIGKKNFPIIIRVDEARTTQEIPLLSNFSNDVSYIKLKTPPNSFINDIRDIQILNDNIFIQVSEKIMVFDMAGNFIKQIGRIGRGPNEYLYLRSFCLDKVNGDLLLFTGYQGYVFKYNSNGELKGKLFEYNLADFMYSLDNILVFSGLFGSTRNMPDNISQFATVNMLGQKIDSVPWPIYLIQNWKEKLLWFSGNFPFIKFNDVLLLYELGADTLFHVTASGKIEPRYLLDFGKFKTPFEINYEIPNKHNSYITAISPPFETFNNLWWEFALNGRAFILRYDKTKQEAFTFFYNGEKEIDFNRGKNSIEELGIVNDIDGGPDFFPEWSVYHDSTQLFISTKETFELKKKITEEYFLNRVIKFPEKKDKLLELVNNLDEKDDYVLMVVKLN